VSPGPPFITFLSDYGVSDDFVGVCHGVIASVCPQARVIDITHGISRQDVRAGAVVLREALPYMPRGVHLAVVDPGVGGRRRAIALRLGDERLMVGPDNGLLWPAAEDCGGIVEAVDIGDSSFRLEPVSATFHGRDIFSPVAARLACGATLADAGERCDPGHLVALELPRARLAGDKVLAHVLYIDRFGNLQLDAGADDVASLGLSPPGRLTLHAGSRAYACSLVSTFADVDPGRLLLYEDSYGRLAVAIREGSAAELLRTETEAEITIGPRE
jgi:S-adenosyl-L-methionine hydrolase (adenosine-forming)